MTGTLNDGVQSRESGVLDDNTKAVDIRETVDQAMFSYLVLRKKFVPGVQSNNQRCGCGR